MWVIDIPELEITIKGLKKIKDITEENFPKMKVHWNFMEKENSE